MRIYCKATGGYSVNSYVNKVGKFIYNKIDSAYKYKVSSNMNDIYMIVMYQIPMPSRIPGGKTEYSEVYEMVIDINVTTYQNKLRINLIEISPDERTLDHFTVDVMRDEDVLNVDRKIMERIRKRLYKMYADYEFIF